MTTTENSAEAQTEPPPNTSLLSGAHRTATIGILMVVTLIAFEAMAVATAMPTAVAALHGLAYYGWPFTGFLVANVVGVVAGGEICDRDGPRRSLLAGLAVFTAGLIVAGAAPDMAAFVFGRAVQGLGGGLVIIAVYIVIAEVYDDRLRPRIFAALSAAWVLPSLVGPVISGALTQHLTWRLVFLSIPPFIVLALLLIMPALRSLAPHPSSGARLTRWRIALIAAIGVATLQYAGQELHWLSLLPFVIGLVLLVGALRRLLPAGTVRVRRGMPAVVAFRGMLAGAFFAVDSFVPLTLSHLHGYGATLAGMPLMIGALGWSAGSWVQGHRQQAHRHRYVRAGFGFVAIAALTMSTLTLHQTPGWVAYLAWLVGGAGMGLVMPTLSLLVLDFSPVAERGKNSSALQICDVIGSALCVGVGGVMVAAAAHSLLSLPVALRLVDITMAVLALSGSVLAGRARGVRQDG
ncbi:MAG TPA: MFS transporter [Mycobacteriales bacterium]|nr:MFS transporter [Mycobacteriales bacterium]